MHIRVGQGFDVHQWEEGKPLMLGGVRLKDAKGLKAHSDGDVLIHAIIDAMLGGAGLGDIGQLFPDTDPQWKGVESTYMLQIAFADIQKVGWEVVNVDTTIITEEPKIAPHSGEMREIIAKILNIGDAAVNIKATTPEKMGSIGRGEGVAAMAVVLLQTPDKTERFKTVSKHSR